MKKFALISAAALTLALGACGPYTLDTQEFQNAKLSAYESAEKNGLEVVEVLNQDSDKDGYVTVSFKTKKPPHDPQERLCPYKAVGACKFKAPKQ
ncbi:hypothetical protein [Methylorubrum suomiense]|uniref:Lipoprotein n=1 Tax=Methylorubrum suomiense TaxID=144191 RepID=A0ABQ4V4U1_9HYPH|nr:hypothetical protein [Methylorubrum suomiense]GJE78137.1 hypothetical protein BGCPKDLD_4748 [Methylorubrum suomiense]